MINWTEILDKYADRLIFASEDDIVTYEEFYDDIVQRGKSIDSKGCIYHELQWTAESFAILFSALDRGVSVVLGNPEKEPDLGKFPEGSPFLIFQTGGTAAKARHVVHSFDKLVSPFQVLDRDEKTVLNLYEPDHIAGIDAFLQAVHRGSTLISVNRQDTDSIGEAIQLFQVNVLAASPSTLSFLLLSGMTENYCMAPVEVIPHGAEPMPEILRERIKKTFKRAVLVNRYGMTETGALPVRNDPEDPGALYLDQADFQWKVEDGGLFVKCPTTCLGTLEDGPFMGESTWYKTDDLAETTDRGSIKILGRRESVINVGGEKVLPEQVEELVLSVPKVEDAWVFAEAHSLTGQTVIAQVVSDRIPNARDLIRSLRKLITEKGISLAHLPTRVDLVDQIERTRLGKLPRSIEYPGKTEE